MANVITVLALNQYVKALLESDAVLTDIALRGEISGFKRHTSGHFYFQLKDANASVNAVMFRKNAAKLSFLPQNGMQVVVRCKISLYEATGAFQVYVEDLFPDGVGAAGVAFEQLKKKLEQEGLFSQGRKRPLPAFPKRIGLITSKTGAALQDILSVTQKRYPLVEYLFCPVLVQGAGAEKEIVAALQFLSGQPGLDAILVARGGGPSEDLWVFNSEGIARAAAASPVPVVSAVGHEVDFTILDFVADLRAPTPSAAAEHLLPDKLELAAYLQQADGNALYSLKNKLKTNEKRFAALSVQALALSPSRQVAAYKKMLVNSSASAKSTIHTYLARCEKANRAAAELAASLNPRQVLRKGYAIVRFENNLLKNPESLVKGSDIEIEMRSANLLCKVLTVQKKKRG